MRAIKGELVSIDDARKLEEQQEYSAAAELYEKLLKASPANLQVLHRLMVLYRRTGEVKKEVVVIEKAISIHHQKYSINQPLSKKATTLSQQLNKMLGHTDKKGKPIVVADEIVKLELRKQRLLKKTAPVKTGKK